MATDGQFCWPPAGIFVAAYGQFFMAANKRRQEGKTTKEIIRCLKRYVAREIYDQLVHPKPAPTAGELRALRTAKHITLQAAADNLRIWPSTLSRFERGLTRDDHFFQRYSDWLNTN